MVEMCPHRPLLGIYISQPALAPAPGSKPSTWDPVPEPSSDDLSAGSEEPRVQHEELIVQVILLGTLIKAFKLKISLESGRSQGGVRRELGWSTLPSKMELGMGREDQRAAQQRDTLDLALTPRKALVCRTPNPVS